MVVNTKLVKSTVKYLIVGVIMGGIQRAGIADGGELEFLPPGTAASLFDKVKN